MTLDPRTLTWLMCGGGLATVLLFIGAISGGKEDDLNRRITRVGTQGAVRKINIRDRQRAVRESRDSTIPFLDYLVKYLPNTDKLRRRLMRTGRNVSLGEYFLFNLLAAGVAFLVFRTLGWSKTLIIPLTIMVGIGLPHMVTGVMGNKRIKKFLATFPEAIDTMTRGIRSGLPVTESMASVGREMPDPVGLEFRRISDGVRVGKTVESAMWEVTRRIDSPEYRFLIIAMAIQKETGGNLAETLQNLSELIRRRRQLRMKIKAMSSEAKASAMIIGSLPFIMFFLLLVINHDYMMSMFHSLGGEIAMGGGFTWMCIGWGTMMKMISFEI